MKKFDYSIEMAKDIILIDQETFNEITCSPIELCEKMKNNSNYITFVSYLENKPAGYIGLMKVSTLHYNAFWIDLIGVRPIFQNLGLGKGMIEDAQKLIKELNLEPIEFISALVRVTNTPSLKAFEKNNFSEDGKGDFKLLFK